MAAKKKVPDNQYDERRETLVMERKTTWSEDVSVADADRARIADALHENPKDAKKLEYILCPTGLIRHVTVTTDDVARLGG